MKIGDNLIGVLSTTFKDENLNAYVLNINLFPISFYIQRHFDNNHFDIKIELFKKINFGMYIKY